MAEAVVSFAVQRLRDLIEREATNLYGVRGPVEWLEDKLMALLLMSEQADKMKRDDENIKKWVKEMIDVASEAQDIIDVYKDLSVLRGQKRAVAGFMQRYMLMCDELIQRHKFHVNVNRIKPKILELLKRGTSHGLIRSETKGTSSESWNPDRSHPPGDEIHIPSIFDYEERSIMSKLVDDDRDKNRLVISIYGMGGVGKTTLAASIYNDPQVTANFDIRIWVVVSQSYIVFEIVKTIALSAGIFREQLPDKLDGLKITVSEKLKNCRYLIVLDDVWTTDVWSTLQRILPNDDNGSGVIITTRVLDVARFENAMVYKLHLLNDEESWELFTRIVFPNQASEICYPKDLIDSARKLVKSCDGLPLALVVLGRYMLTQLKSKHAWENVAANYKWQVEHDELKESLAKSYYDLSYYMKSCFFYFGCFREGIDIPAKTLIRLWSVDDGLRTMFGETMEKIEMGCLKELEQRSMIKVTKRKYDDSAKYCQIENFFLDVCISEATERRFLQVYDNDNKDVATSSNKARRLIIFKEIQILNYSNPNLQGLFYGVHNPLKFTALKEPLRRFKLLRVLYLNIQDMSELPSEIKSLIHLRYLELHADNLEEVPSWIGHLQNLQTFVIRSKVLEMISDSLWSIESLRYVDVPTSSSAPNMGNIVLKDLQALKVVTAGKIWMENMLPKFTNLCKLNICEISDVHANALSSSIKNLKILASLTIKGDEIPLVNIITAFSNDHKLRKLYLDGNLNCKQLPSNEEFPQNLVKLSLISSELEHDPMETLEKLPFLRYLELGDDSYVGKKMKCSANHFTKLESLSIRCCDELEEWNIEKGAMPCLKSLQLFYCPKLTVIPEGLKNVQLDNLALDCLPEELMTRINEKNGEDWYNIQHVPNITKKPL